jgi:hypothetical protein
MKNDITIQNMASDGATLTILEGKALEQKYPKKIDVVGNIEAVSAFLKKRESGHDLQKVDQSKVIVIVDKEEMYIMLQLDPQNEFGTVIKGVLEKSPELEKFHINEAKTYKREELVQLIRFNRLAFDNGEQHQKVLAAYMAFEAKTAGEIGASSDTRGNKAASFKKEVTTNIPMEFTLLIPIFKGKEPLRFRVEICIDVTDGGARFWFESTELAELIETHKEIIFNEELKWCADFVIINK